MSIHLTQIKAFLNRPGIEGPQRLRGYIPSHRKRDGNGRNYIGPLGTDPIHTDKEFWPATGESSEYAAMGISGVTIATGVDLGQTDFETLERSGL